MNQLSRISLALISIFILITDYVSKHLILQSNIDKRLPIMVNSFFNIDLVYNKGISFGLFQQLGNSNIIFAISTIILSIILLIWQSKTEIKLEKFAIALIIGGALGNFLDRVLYGAVVDFLIFHIDKYVWPAFNIADSMISIGVMLIIFGSLIFNNNGKKTNV